MAFITSFNAVAQLAVSDGKSPAFGLCSDIGSESGVGVQGDGLGGMQIQVTRTDGTGPRWTGTLSDSANDRSEWVANLTCGTTSPGVGTGGNDGDPEDVPVTVEAGTDLTKKVDAKYASATVNIGPAPKV